MSRTRPSGLLSRALVVFAFPLYSLVAVAGPITGGNIEIVSSVFAPGGAERTAGIYAVEQTVANPQGAVASASGGAFELTSGFLGGASGPNPGLATSELDPSRYRYDLPTTSFLGYNPALPLSITFSEAMSQVSLASAILLETVESPVGNTLASPVSLPLAISYDAPNRKAIIVPSAGSLDHNTGYQLTVTTRAASASGLPLAAPVVYRFATLAEAAVDNSLIASDAQTQVEIPSGAAPQDYYVVLRVDPENEPELMDPAALAEATAKAKTDYSEYDAPLADSLREFTAYAGDRSLITSFSEPVTLEIPFNDANGDGIVDGSNPAVRVESLAVWYLNEERKLWVRLPNPTVDTARGVVSAKTDHFSTFALIGAQDTNVSQVRVYPIPFRPNAGDPARYGLATEGIHFDNLPDAADIRIFTLSGRQVKRIIHSGLGEERWLGVNDDGQRVASGVYHYLIKSGSNKKTGKLMVIW